MDEHHPETWPEEKRKQAEAVQDILLATLLMADWFGFEVHFNAYDEGHGVGDVNVGRTGLLGDLDVIPKREPRGAIP